MKLKNNKIKGTTLENSQEHKSHHKLMERRQFLNTLGKGSVFSMMMGGVSMKAMSSPALLNALNNADEDRILVLVQLGGGNDGINTLIPMYDYDFYRNVRPKIGYTENQTIPLTNDIAIPANCSALDNMWKDGMMKAIQAVGYPDQNLSHFRSSDIWSSSSDSNQVLDSGWLGRYLGDVYPDYEVEPPSIPPAVQIGGIGSLIFNNGTFNMGVNVTNPEELSEIAKNGELFDTKDVPENCYGDELRFLRTVTNSTFIYSEAIQKAFQKGQNKVEYQIIASDLSNQLSIVSRLIKGGLGTRLYMVTINGFDTHAGQNDTHPFLWQDIATSVESFFEDLRQDGLDKEVLAVTFSEFGRRIEENASGGTDHGSAAPVLLFGPGLNGNGIIGENPNLQAGDQYGNLDYQMDFRSIYATILEHWMCVDSPLVDQLLGNYFPRVPDLVLQCGAITSTKPESEILSRIGHKALYSPTGEVQIKYSIEEPNDISLSIFDLAGHHLGIIDAGPKSKGTHMAFIRKLRYKMTAGTYVYQLTVGGRKFSNKFILS